MKIVLFANTSWYIVNFRKNLIKTLLRAGHDIFVISPPDDYVEKFTKLGIHYYPFKITQRGKNPFREIVTCLRLLLMLKKINPDFVLTFTVKCNLYAGLCRRLLKFEQIPNISGLGEAFEENNMTRFLVSRLYKFALVNSKQIFFQNKEDMDLIIGQQLLPEHLCTRIPGSGVDLDTFSPSPISPIKPARVFLMLGRVVPKKGYDLFLKAAKQLRYTGENNIEFRILGIPDNSRRESRKLFKRIMNLHEKGIVQYQPPTDDVASVLRNADVVILPSQYHEGVPRSLLEAMACGKPIITTDWKGCRETVDHGHNGYLIDINDFNSLLYYIKKFVNTPSEKILEMGKASRKKAENHFDENKVSRSYLQAIC